MPKDVMNKRVRIEIQGRVQGVGFRPTVWRHATGLGLAGYVRNTPAGVVIEAEGPPAAVDRFVARLRTDPPRQARIDAMQVSDLPVKDSPAPFEIQASGRSGDLRAGMPPDLATCADCRAELFEPANRRHRYPFINCTNCGPRFTIIRELPYDRERTSMAAFDLCPACRKEYLDPADRRFDAQPNACPVCGPRVELIVAENSQQNEPTLNIQRPTFNVQLLTSNAQYPVSSIQHPTAEAAIEEAVRLLRGDGIVAVKGVGGYHLACSAVSADAVARLRARKRRPHKSLAVMFANLDEILRHAEVSAAEAEWLTSCAAPIVILRRKPASTLSKLISPDTDDIGAFLPYSPLHHLLLAGISPLVMTSGNLAEEPIAMDEEQLQRILGTIADAALVHNRPILRRCDDSVLKLIEKQPCVEERNGDEQARALHEDIPRHRLTLRRSRGLVPDSIQLPAAGPPVLACGADLKNTICIGRDNEAFLSQHIGDLEDYPAYRFFGETIADLAGLLKVRPEIIAHDLHPDYYSTRFALSPQAGAGRRVAVQHHHAHIAACLAEHQLAGPAIGVALDGTGYGPDGTIWGGEFLVADLKTYRRVGHFKQYRLPGGEEAIRHPERLAFSILQAEGLGEAADLLPALAAEQRKMLTAMLAQALNSPLTSSAGRLFDAVSALLGLGDSISYEARAAIRLQTLADRNGSGNYPFEIAGEVLSFGPMFSVLLTDLRGGTDRAVIAGKFHRTVAAGVSEMCRRIRAAEKLNTAALSGGVFQNDYLLELVKKDLLRDGFAVYSPEAVPPNDGGIALGQAAVARKNC
jgi:hydrogenase maturation protein HypF